MRNRNGSSAVRGRSGGRHWLAGTVAAGWAALAFATTMATVGWAQAPQTWKTTVTAALHDTSPTLATMIAKAPPPPPPLTAAQRAARRAAFVARMKAEYAREGKSWPGTPAIPDPVAPPPVAAGAAAVEQTELGTRPAAALVASFEGLGADFKGPQGTAQFHNPSDNSLAVGPQQIVQVVNSRFAIYTKAGQAQYGPVATKTIFEGFQGSCGETDFGDAVARYDQLAKRWVFVLPIFRRPSKDPKAPYAMCYAVSATSDLLGRYYRYEFERPLFPDYPRLGVWRDGYYLGTSSGDTVIQKHACVADRTAMLRGAAASEQCAVIDGINFLNPADVEGHQEPAKGEPELIFAAGGTQLHKIFDADAIYYYRFHVDWKHPEKSRVTGPFEIAVAPYHYLCNGQLTSCVPQPGTERRLDAQGDKLMQRVVYRRRGRQETIAAMQSVNTRGGGGGVRWYEMRLDRQHLPTLEQQGTYAPGGGFRWMGSLGIDRKGDIAMGYSYGDAQHFAGQRLTGRLADDPRGQMTLGETILARGEAAQTGTVRWEDYTTLDLDPSDGCTFWYVGDYHQRGAKGYSTRIGAIRLPGCENAGHRE